MTRPVPAAPARPPRPRSTRPRRPTTRNTASTTTSRRATTTPRPPPRRKRTSPTFSLGVRDLASIRDLKGEIHTKDVEIAVTDKAGAVKNFSVQMIMYSLKDEALNLSHRGRWVITKFTADLKPDPRPIEIPGPGPRADRDVRRALGWHLAQARSLAFSAPPWANA